jgi:hypothetical protein
MLMTRNSLVELLTGVEAGEMERSTPTILYKRADDEHYVQTPECQFRKMTCNEQDVQTYLIEISGQVVVSVGQLSVRVETLLFILFGFILWLLPQAKVITSGSVVDILVLGSHLGQKAGLKLFAVKGARESQILRVRSRDNTVRHDFRRDEERRWMMMKYYYCPY